MSNIGSWLVPPLALAFAMSACGGGTQSPQQDTGVQDAPAQTDLPVEQAQVTPDGGVDDAAAPHDAADASAAMDGPGIECAPPPSGGSVPAGTAPMQAAGPTVATSPTRPELSAEVADGKYTIRKALAQGYLINDGTAPDGGVGQVTYSANDNWDPLTNGIGDPATFTPTFTVAADGSGTHTSLFNAFSDANNLGVCGRVYIRLMPGEYRGQVLLASKTSAPAITLYSTESDASKTVIVANQAGATAGSMTLSATLTIKAVRGFQMKNITVANDYVEGSAPATRAPWPCCCRAINRSSRTCGSSATSAPCTSSRPSRPSRRVRTFATVTSRAIRTSSSAAEPRSSITRRSNIWRGGSPRAEPSRTRARWCSTATASCSTAATSPPEAGASGVFLARQWMEESDTIATRGMPVGKMIVRNSTLGAHLAGAAPWSTMGARMTTPKDPAGTTPVVVYTSDDFFPAGVGPVTG